MYISVYIFTSRSFSLFSPKFLLESPNPLLYYCFPCPHFSDNDATSSPSKRTQVNLYLIAILWLTRFSLLADDEVHGNPPAYSPCSNSTAPEISTNVGIVSFNQVYVPVNNRQQVTKAIFSSNLSVSSLNNIIGTYLRQKRANEKSRQYGGNISGPYRRSQPEVQMYNHIMHKIERLSGAVIQRKSSLREDWETAVGPYRREIFLELYGKNEIVRCFAEEMPNGTSTLPSLDNYALGISRGRYYSPPKAQSFYPQTLLSKVRTVVLMDDSGSMSMRGHNSWDADYANSLETRWDQARRMLASLAPVISSYSEYGIDLHFLNRKRFYTGLRTQSEVMEAFNAGRPEHGTPTGQRINDLLDGYMSTLRYYRKLMPLNLLVITDGEANDPKVLHWAIEEHVTKIIQRGYPAHQFGIEFIQVGDCELATRHLIELEEEVSRHHLSFKRDIVGVTPITRITRMDPESLLAIMVSGIDARLNGYMRKRGVNV